MASDITTGFQGGETDDDRIVQLVGSGVDRSDDGTVTVFLVPEEPWSQEPGLVLTEDDALALRDSWARRRSSSLAPNLSPSSASLSGPGRRRRHGRGPSGLWSRLVPPTGDNNEEPRAADNNAYVCRDHVSSRHSRRRNGPPSPIGPSLFA